MYVWKRYEELAWFVAVAVATVLFQALAEFDPTTITDYRAWGVSLGAAAVRAGAGAALAYFTRPQREESDA